MPDGGQHQSTIIDLRTGVEHQPHTMTRIPSVRLGDEKLLHHWQTNFVHLISISAAGSRNPFLVHLTPLLTHSASLRSLITSMAANHLAQLQPESTMAMLAIQHRIRAVAYLRRDMVATADPETSLATIVMLQLADRLFMEDSGVNHLQGANALISHRGGQEAWSSSSAGRFLLGLCWYHDVLLSVSKSQAPFLGLKNMLVEGLSDSSRLSIVLSLVGEISGLRSETANGQESNNNAKEQRILSELVSLEETGHHLDDNARNVEIHRLSGLIYFYRSTTTQAKSSDSYLSLYSRLCLQHLAKIPCYSPITSSHIWPLWTAGCEATDRVLRDLVLQRLDEMFKLRRLTFLQRIKQDILGVWDMKDSRRDRSGRDDIDCVTAVLSVYNRDVDIV
ncbi:fungal-specific transcription factor domain-containing protein [Aspergillus germanicus]